MEITFKPREVTVEENKLFQTNLDHWNNLLSKNEKTRKIVMNFPVGLYIQHKVGRYVFGNRENTYVLKIVDSRKNVFADDEIEGRVQNVLIANPRPNLLIPVITAPVKTNDVNGEEFVITFSVMRNLGVSPDHKVFRTFSGHDKVYFEDFRKCIIDLKNGLDNLHKSGFFHRDCTPTNVLYSKRLGTWTLIDYGFCIEVGTPFKTLATDLVYNNEYEYALHPWIYEDQRDGGKWKFKMTQFRKTFGAEFMETNFFFVVDYFALLSTVLSIFELKLKVNDTSDVTMAQQLKLCFNDDIITKDQITILRAVYKMYEMMQGNTRQCKDFYTFWHGQFNTALVSAVELPDEILPQIQEDVEGDTPVKRRKLRNGRTGVKIFDF
jgi:hypothetical protein